MKLIPSTIIHGIGDVQKLYCTKEQLERGVHRTVSELGSNIKKVGK